MSTHAANPRKRPAETQEDAWVADEDRFVLEQAKKKAILRVKAGRAKPIDYLTVALRTVEPSRNAFDDDEGDDQSLIVNPETVFAGLSTPQLHDLEREVDTYLALEKNKSNYEYWKTMKLVCRDRRQGADDGQGGRGVSSVNKDLDKVLGPKNLKELESLEKQIKKKLRSDEAIDVDYWENLLKRLAVHKARAQLRKVSQDIMGARAASLKKDQVEDAEAFGRRVVKGLASPESSAKATVSLTSLDPDSALKVSSTDKVLPVVNYSDFHASVKADRKGVTEAGYVSGRPKALAPSGTSGSGDHQRQIGPTSSAAYDREVARGMDEDEEVFATEEQVSTNGKPAWADRYVPRKPRYFNRVQLGFEWNKYNQTHYDQDNPPPQVVQGYKFNIFYPDLIDKMKAPTYRMERENGRKRGETSAPAGEEDTCVIRFTAGPPYEDVAFRIVDREWDYSARRERGFKSSFDKGMLQLHFQFKKIYYRK